MVAVETKYDAACFTSGPTEKVGIAIHWWDLPQNHPSYEGTIDTFVSGARQTSAHYVAEAGRAACLVNPADVAWANGNWAANLSMISIECNPRQSDGDYQSIGELIAQIRKEQGKDLPLHPHREFTPTECPGTYDLARLDAIARKVAGGAVPTKPKPNNPAPSKPTPPAPGTKGKTISQLADEVIKGVWGSGDARVKALGPQYQAVQNEVNRRFGAGQIVQRPKPNIAQLATDTIAGKYGNGEQRRVALGANYAAVMAEVNKRLGAGAAPQVNIGALADAVLRGEYGDGADRQRRLGQYYDAVQAEVNRRMG